MNTATLVKPIPEPDAEEAARAARLAETRRRVRELIDNDPEFAAMIAAAASGDPSDEAEPEIMEFRAQFKPASGGAGHSSAARLREEFFRRKNERAS